MEETRDKKTVMELPPPSYFPQAIVRRQSWVWASVVMLLLAVLVVGATLIGVYMTQKHTEAVVEMAFHAGSGEKVQQTVMVNDKENMAAFYVKIGNVSTTFLYDYRREIVGIRSIGDSECYAMRMSKTNVPTMEDILNSIRKPNDEDARGRDFTYDLVKGERADKIKLGVPTNLLCSDLPVYWASQESHPQQRFLRKLVRRIKNSIKNTIKNIIKDAIKDTVKDLIKK